MRRPEVVIIQEASVDGKLSVSMDKPLLYGDPRWDGLRRTGSFDVVKWYMSTRGVQATLEGSLSFVRNQDSPGLLPPFEGDPKYLFDDYLPEEIIHRESHQGWFIAVDSQGRIRWMYKDGYPGDDTWKGWHLLVLVSQETPVDYLAYLRFEKIPYLMTGGKSVDLAAALEKIYALLGVKILLSTAGGMLNGQLLKAGLVDEINIQFLPGIIGNQAPGLFRGFDLSDAEDPIQLSLVSCMVQEGGHIWVRYLVDRQAS